MGDEINDSKLRRDDYTFDILRTIVLGAYIKSWGMPELRLDFSRNGVTPPCVEMHYFPGSADQHPARFATVGLSREKRRDGEQTGIEFLMALPSDLGGETSDVVFNYFADVIAHNIESAKNSITPRVIQSTTLAPTQWTTTALLIDELRGEDDSIETIMVGSQKVTVQWVVPITQNEAKLILLNGVEAFDQAEGISEYSLIDVRRQSFC
jgi:Suppressor of fused protein (SUFU)